MRRTQSIEFLSPLAGLVALLGLVPLAAFVDARMRALGGGARSASRPPRRAHLVPLAALVAAAACLGLAAMQPVASLEETRRVRTDRGARRPRHHAVDARERDARSPSRMDRAKGWRPRSTRGSRRCPSASRRSLIARSPPVPERGRRGVPGDAREGDRGRAAPAVHTFSNRVTNLEALGGRHAGDSLPDDQQAGARGRHRRREPPRDAGAPRPVFRRPPGIETVFVQVWDRDERVFRRQVPEPGAGPTRARARRSTGSQPRSTARCSRRTGSRGGDPAAQLVGSGPSVVQGERRRDIPLAPYLAAFAFVPLVLVLWRRDR